MRRILFLALFAIAFTIGGAAAAVRIAPGQYTQITLSRAGQPAEIEVELKATSILAPYALFAPSALGPLKFEAQNSDGEMIDLRSSTPLPVGIYHIKISAKAASPTPFNITMRKLGVAEDFSGNNTRDTARKIDLPLHTVLALRSAKDEAWYTFDVPGPGVVLVRLARLDGASGAVFHVESNISNAANATSTTPISAGSRSGKDGVASRYFEAKGPGTWRVRATRNTGSTALGGEAASRFDLVFYPDKPDTEGAPAFVALGTSPDDPNIQQIRLRLRAMGEKIVVTNDPDDIQRALVAAAKPRRISIVDRALHGRPWIVWIAGIILFAGLGAGGYFLWRRQTATPQTTQPGDIP